MRKSIVWLFLLLLLCGNAQAVDVNLSLTGTATGSGGASGTPSNTVDNNLSTFYLGVLSAMTVEVQLSKPSIISSVDLYHWSTCNSITGTWSLFYAGQWNVIATDSWGIFGSAANPTLHTKTGPWSGVTKVKISVTKGNLAHGYSEIKIWGHYGSSGYAAII